MYVEERVCTVEARKVRAMPRRQGAKPYEAHCVEEIRNKCPQKREKSHATIAK